MAKIIFCFILNILVISASLAQENYQPGSVVLSEGDTLRGYIDYRNWNTNPEYIVYSNDPASSRHLYYPPDIQSFEVAGERYVSALVDFEISSRSSSNPDMDRSLKIRTDSVFLSTIISGPKSLYFYRDKDKKDNYYILKSEGFELLLHKEYYVSESKKGEDNTYRIQLYNYLSDCPSIFKKIEDLNYSENSISSLFQYYFLNSGYTVEYSKQVDRMHVEFGIFTGAVITKILFYSSYREFNYLVESDFEFSTNPTLGVSFNAVFPRTREQWSLNNEILFRSYKATAVFTDYYPGGEPSLIANNTFAHAFLTLNSMLRFTYPLKGVQIFANAGISNSVVIKESYNLSERQIFYNSLGDYTFSNIPALPYTRNHEIGFLAGAGVSFRNFFFEARIERGKGLSKTLAVNSNMDRVIFLLGYSF